MKSLFFVFMLAILGLHATASACTYCSQRSTYAQSCVSSLISAGYNNPGAFNEICSSIRTRAAYDCINGLISHGYNHLNWQFGVACSGATDCGVEALNALFDNNYNTNSEFIAEIGRARNAGLANCYAQVFNAGYSNLTVYNIHSICGY